MYIKENNLCCILCSIFQGSPSPLIMETVFTMESSDLPPTCYTMLYMYLFTPHPVHVTYNFVSMFVKISLHASNVHEQSTCINFEIFIFMGFRLSVKLLLVFRNNLWVVGEILIHFVILCFNSLPHYQSMLMQTPEKGGDCVERWLGLEFWWSLRNPSKNLSLTFV